MSFHARASEDLRRRADTVRDIHRETFEDELTVSIKLVGYEIAAALFGIADALKDDTLEIPENAEGDTP